MTNYTFYLFREGMGCNVKENEDRSGLLAVYICTIFSCGLYPLGLLVADIFTLPITIPLTIITSIYSFYKKINRINNNKK